MRIWIALLGAVAAGSLALAAVRAEPINDLCPVSGEKADPLRRSDVKIGFCCANCKGRFDREPEAYLGKVGKIPNEKCPLSGKALGDAVSTVTVAFCSEGCKGKFDKEPGAYLGKIKAREKK